MTRTAILLATCNGERYLPQQLASFTAQTVTNWRLYASDDGSTDATVAILGDFQAAQPAHAGRLLAGPRRGFAANFMRLLTDPGIEADCFALADQDDVWRPDKLAAALGWLATQPPDRPALYCGTSLLIDAQGARLGPSPVARRAPGIRNALVENIAGGNTMVLNRAARDLLRRAASARTEPVPPWHDWWIYLAVTACGGTIHYDPVPHLLYRQHARNVHGANRLLHGIRRRLRGLWNGTYREWNDTHMQLLDGLRDAWSPDAAQAVQAFQRARRCAGLHRRLASFAAARLYRQFPLEQCGLWLAVLLRKI